jgi:hypothetical protein
MGRMSWNPGARRAGEGWIESPADKRHVELRIGSGMASVPRILGLPPDQFLQSAKTPQRNWETDRLVAAAVNNVPGDYT